ncbi:mitochondrial genome maintenance exonuclease 1-like [Cloeon dipterum]|uniref:mitochondrial genome maintenance exonuclease 1-like n=1 Tax=Cloeon dipterum TaxID=197152 RepID=UPI00322096C8
MINFVFRPWPHVVQCQVRALSKKAANTAKKPFKTNAVKAFNTENKIFYGALLETAAERRKTRNTQPYKVEDFVSSAPSVDYNQFASAFESEPPTKSTKGKAVKPTAKTGKNLKQQKAKDEPKEAKEETILNESTTSPLPIITSSAEITGFPMLNIAKQVIKIPPSLNLWKVPSVTKILSATMSESSKAALEKWKANLIAQLGLEGFQEYQKNLFLRGSQFHSVIQNHLSGKPLTLPPEIEGCWSSVSKVMPELGMVMNLESPVLHPTLQYRGIIDCIAEFRGEPMVIEWKKSDKRKPIIQYTYDAPLQMTAYIGAMNFDSSYPKKIKQGAVVVAYTDGTPADIFVLNLDECTHYWNVWLDRLQLYWKLNQTASQNSL